MPNEVTDAMKRALRNALLRYGIDDLDDAEIADIIAAMRAADTPPVGPCSMGVGCDEMGVCYAAAHNQPEQCPRTPPVANTLTE